VTRARGGAAQGPAIGRPSNAGVCHLKNKQCRADGCTHKAYFGDPFDGCTPAFVDQTLIDLL